MARRRTVGLCELGVELQEVVLCWLDATSLARLQACCRAFRAFGPGSGCSDERLRVVERAAKAAVLAANRDCLEEAQRHSRMGWLERMFVEECEAGFDRRWEVRKADDAGFRFMPHAAGASQILLQGMGPKLLLSDASTSQRPMLRWRLVVRGNTAVEFGVVPATLQYGTKGGDGVGEEQGKVHKALHKCKHPDGTDFGQSIGFSSAITVGSMLPFKVPLMKGSVVEVLATRGRFAFLVHNPPDAQELFWSGAGNHARTVPKPYKGPQRFSMEQAFDPRQDVRLALTCWAQGVFDVVSPAPGALRGREAIRAEAAVAAATAACGPLRDGPADGRALAVRPARQTSSDSRGTGPSGSGASSGASGPMLNARSAAAAVAGAEAQQQRQRHPPPQQQQQQQQHAPSVEVVDLTTSPSSPSDHSTGTL